MTIPEAIEILREWIDAEGRQRDDFHEAIRMATLCLVCRKRLSKGEVNDTNC